jgi:hypothetical protein
VDCPEELDQEQKREHISYDGEDVDHLDSPQHCFVVLRESNNSRARIVRLGRCEKAGFLQSSKEAR